MLVDACVEVVELVGGPVDEPRRAGVVRRLAAASTSAFAHPRQRCLERGQRVEVDAAVDGAQGVEVDLVEGLGDGRRAGRPDAAHVDDGRAVLGDDGHERGSRRPAAPSTRSWAAVERRRRPSRNELGGVVELVVLELRRRPARPSVRPAASVVARLRRLVAEAGRGDAGEHDRRRPIPANAAAARSVDRRLMPVTNDEARGGARRRAPTAPRDIAELGPGQDVERHAEGHGEHVGAVAARRADPERSAEGERGDDHEQRIERRWPAPPRRRRRRPTTGRARR